MENLHLKDRYKMGKYSNSVWTEYIHMFFNLSGHYNRRRRLRISILNVAICTAIFCHLFESSFVSSRPIHSVSSDVGVQNLTDAMVSIYLYTACLLCILTSVPMVLNNLKSFKIIIVTRGLCAKLVEFTQNL